MRGQGFQGSKILVNAFQLFKISQPRTNLVAALTKTQLDECLSPFDLKRLESYADNMLDYHVIVDMIPLIVQLHFTGRLRGSIKLAGVREAVLMAIGLQRKTLEDIKKKLNLPPAQVLAMFQKTIRKVAMRFRHLLSHAIIETLPQEAEKSKQKKINDGTNDNEVETDKFHPIEQSLADDLQEEGEEVMASMKLKEKQRELVNLWIFQSNSFLSPMSV